jgi:hypothetical protein
MFQATKCQFTKRAHNARERRALTATHPTSKRRLFSKMPSVMKIGNATSTKRGMLMSGFEEAAKKTGARTSAKP